MYSIQKKIIDAEWKEPFVAVHATNPMQALSILKNDRIYSSTQIQAQYAILRKQFIHEQIMALHRPRRDIAAKLIASTFLSNNEILEYSLWHDAGIKSEEIKDSIKELAELYYLFVIHDGADTAHNLCDWIALYFYPRSIEGLHEGGYPHSPSEYAIQFEFDGMAIMKTQETMFLSDDPYGIRHKPVQYKTMSEKKEFWDQFIINYNKGSIYRWPASSPELRIMGHMPVWDHIRMIYIQKRYLTRPEHAQLFINTAMRLASIGIIGAGLTHEELTEKITIL